MPFVDELRLEQAHVDSAYERLEALRAAATQVGTPTAADGKGGTFADRVARDVATWTRLRRLGALDDDRPLCFGRIDTTDGDRFHIGRVALSDEEGDPLLVDWRAPVAEGFYRATFGEPLNLVRRRHLRCRGRAVEGLDDEIFADATDDHSVVGEAALLRSLRSRRTGRMSDIVATIQSEQDHAIRAPLDRVLVVHGGPGTGKTAVALHRAAYLLYTHPTRLLRDGVLVIGPNPVFLHYVENVLPSLGETDVVMATITDLVVGGPFRAPEPRAVARLKGELRLATVIERAVRDRQRAVPADVRIPFGGRYLKLSRGASRQLVERVRDRVPTHNEGHVLLQRSLVRHLARQVDDRPATEVAATLRTTQAVQEVVARMWPALTSEQLLGDLFSARPLLESAAAAHLSPDEIAALHRPEWRDGDIRWSHADAPLHDEARALLGPLPAPARTQPAGLRIDDALERTLSDMGLIPHCPDCDAELMHVGGPRPWKCDVCWKEWRHGDVLSEGAEMQLRDIAGFQGAHAVAPQRAHRATFGHVIVDEAQDLSPMAWRMVGRRSPGHSVTVVGDLAQGARPGGTWGEVLETVAAGRPVDVIELSVNYRMPAEAAAVAEAVLRAARPEARVPRAVRSAGVAPRFVRVDHEAPDRRDVVAAIATEEAAAVSPGRVGVIVPEGVDATDDPQALDERVSWLHLDAARGLEFDAVVVVDPIAIEADHGPGGLYVALSRTTERLVVVHAGDLPEALRPFDAADDATS